MKTSTRCTVLGFVLALALTGLPTESSAADGLFGLPPIPRDAFNRIAQYTGLPVLWEFDHDSDGVPDPDEVLRLRAQPSYMTGDVVRDGAFLPNFEKAYRAVVETLRREAVRRELDQGRPTVVRSDLTDLSPQERTFVEHMLEVGRITDDLYIRQRGAAAYQQGLSDADAASQTLFWRNSGPWCTAPQTEADPFCNASPAFPERKWDVWPPEMTHDLALCETVQSHPNARALIDPFAVVRMRGGELTAVPYTEVYAEPMGRIAGELLAAADALEGLNEGPLQKYLRAAAVAFGTNEWEPADEAWAAMNARNSKWYVRVGPDEVYWDLCNQKAGFHLSFARIDERSVEWQDKMAPLRDEMERTLAQLIGRPYTQRDVHFMMPDFIRIVANAGNSRSPLGATAGQALPNWGKVAEEGRGRMMVVTNIYEDEDSKKAIRAKAATMLGPKAMRNFTHDPLPSLLSVILHEATHNLGPCSDYLVKGKAPKEVFGGGLASTLEELKAQTGALFFTDMLRRNGLITEAQALQMYTHDIIWAFGQIARGLYTKTGGPKPYGQLAAVQVGRLAEAGALIWETRIDPETDLESGRFLINYERIPQAVQQLMREVGGIKARGDVKAAKKLLARYLDGPGAELVHAEEIQERLRKFPKGTLVYSVDL